MQRTALRAAADTERTGRATRSSLGVRAGGESMAGALVIIELIRGGEGAASVYNGGLVGRRRRFAHCQRLVSGDGFGVKRRC